MANVFLVMTIVLIAVVNAAKESKEYGYFDYSIILVENCQGPKRKECCYNSFKLHDNRIIVFDMDCKESVSPTKAKIVAFKNRQKIRLQMDKPCKHPFIKPIITKMFNATEDCFIAKNKYHFELDFVTIAQKYYSGMFLYGDWTFESVFYNNVCNFLCMNLNVTFQPKKEH